MIKHSKFKNTGVLFELLLRQATSDLMSKKATEAIKLFKKYFINTELGREYALYNTVLNAPKLTEHKAEIFISTVISQSEKLDRTKLNKEKYNLIKEIKRCYDIDNFFQAKIPAYKVHAAVYTLIESHNQKQIISPKQVFANRETLLEHITKDTLVERKVASEAAQEFLKEDKSVRILAYKILVEKFNQKYTALSAEQQDLLREYINNLSETKQLKAYLNSKLETVKKELTALNEQVSDAVIKIKINEILTLIKPLSAKESIKDEVLVSLMQYYQLIKELKTLNK